MCSSDLVPGQDIRLFMWNKRLAEPTAPAKATVLLVHGSSVSSTPVYDLAVPGRDDASLMDWLARLGYDVWCFDCEGYGRSDKSRPVTADVAMGADDLEVVSEAILRLSGSQQLMVYGSSSGALRAALFAQRQPQRVARLVNLEGFGMPATHAAQAPTRMAQWLDELAQARAGERGMRPYADLDGVAQRQIGRAHV